MASRGSKKKKTAEPKSKQKTKARGMRTDEGVELPAELMTYLNRIGAEVLNFRRAMVKEYVKGKNYYYEKTLIKIAGDGTISLKNKEHAPTPEEQEAIISAFAETEFPKSIHATRAGYEKFLTDQGINTENFYALYDRRDGQIIMVQQRIRNDDGSKSYLPHTFFSDGIWRGMEPDQDLPFWKPRVARKARIMIHEGAKAARFMHKLVNEPDQKEALARHPWKDTIEKYDHWGLIGGALAPTRADYKEITRETPTEVIYVCDNDHAGQSALHKVSESYGASLKGVMFGKEFPVHWDMGDPMPEGLFSSSGRWKGPSFRALMKPATFATKIVPNPEGKGRHMSVLRPDFHEEWMHSVKPEVFIHRDFPDNILSEREFNNEIAPYSNVDDTARLLKKEGGSKVTHMRYDPAKLPGVYGMDGRHINTHVPSDIKEEKGDAGPWLEFMDMLVPDDHDRIELFRWVATLIARPDIKMLYGVLLISETQGIGKGTLGEKILMPLIGKDNTSFPNENEVVESQFNYWLAHKRLAVVHEIYAGQSSKAYNKLKSTITDRTVNVNKKFMAAYQIENWIHIFACSNSMRAIQLSMDDRRWFVPKITEDKKDVAYWDVLNEWLEEHGGLGIIKRWAREWLEENTPVKPGDPSPWSSTKAAVVEEGYSPGMQLVSSFIEKAEHFLNDDRWVIANLKPATANGAWKCPGAAVFDTSLVRLIQQQIHQGRVSDRLERPLTVRKVVKAKGWYEHPERHFADGSAHGRLMVSDKALTLIPLKDVLKEVKVLDATSLAQQWFPM